MPKKGFQGNVSDSHLIHKSRQAPTFSHSWSTHCEKTRIRLGWRGFFSVIQHSYKDSWILEEGYELWGGTNEEHLQPLPLTSGVSVTLGRSLRLSASQGSLLLIFLFCPLTSAHAKSLTPALLSHGLHRTLLHPLWTSPLRLLCPFFSLWPVLSLCSPSVGLCSLLLTLHPHLSQLLAPRVSASTCATSTPRTLSQSQSLLRPEYSMPGHGYPCIS